MKNYKIVIAYNGTRYKGWQVQSKTEETIQGKLQKVLEGLCGHKVEVIGSGRTDAGVHAIAQVANFHLEDTYGKKEIFEHLNHYLPEDIAVIEIEEVDERFHSRFHAVDKTYVYRVWRGIYPNVFERKFMYRIKEPLDLVEMKKAAKFLEGTHDFMSFCGNKKMKKSTVRTVREIKIEEIGDELRFSFAGDGFLQNMVRIMVGTLLDVGLGKIQASDMTEILEAKDRSKAGTLAPAEGLRLEKVVYGTVAGNE